MKANIGVIDCSLRIVAGLLSLAESTIVVGCLILIV